MNAEQSWWDSINIFKMVSKIGTPETFKSYYNMAPKQMVKLEPLSPLPAPGEGILRVILQVDNEINIIDVQWTNLKTILTDMGGYYAALFHFSLAFASPFLYLHFNKSITEASQEEDALEKCKERVTFGTLYYLQDRLERIENKLKASQGDDNLEQRVMMLRLENQRLQKLLDGITE